jgi:hypothetical protein
MRDSLKDMPLSTALLVVVTLLCWRAASTMWRTLLAP